MILYSRCEIGSSINVELQRCNPSYELGRHENPADRRTDPKLMPTNTRFQNKNLISNNMLKMSRTYHKDLITEHFTRMIEQLLELEKFQAAVIEATETGKGLDLDIEVNIIQLRHEQNKSEGI